MTEMKMKTNLELVDECDSFPYPGTPARTSLLSTLYTLVYTSPEDNTTTPIGYVPEFVFNELAKVPVSIKGELTVNRKERILSVFQQPTEAERSSTIAATLNYWRGEKTFKVLAGWRNELYPVYGPKNELIYNIERSAATLFGFVTYGVHLTAYILSPSSPFGIKLWIPRRSKTKQTYPSLLDNTVAGGMATGEIPFECLIREASEEASLPSSYVRTHAVPKGIMTYSYIRDTRAGGETGTIQPECQYLYDLLLPPNIIPKPNDTEVESFELMDVEQVKEALGKGEFKPNCALCVLEFFARWGVIGGKEGEEIRKRVGRRLEFPGPHWDVKAVEEGEGGK